MAERTKRWLQIGLAVVVVIGIFVGLLPKLADMGEVWTAVREMRATDAGVLLAATGFNQATYWFVAMAALPGLSFAQAAVSNLAPTAVANTVPAGGGVAIGLTTAMLRSWGFTNGDVGRYIVITGIWNNFLKLGLPVVALGLLAITGDSTGQLLITAIIGIAVLVASVVILGLMLRSEKLARSIGARTGSAVSWLRGRFGRDPVEGWDDRAADFRKDSVELLADRWHWLTITTILGHLALFSVLLASLRILGVSPDDLSWIQALAGFAFARLITAIPITPGGAGMIELGYVGVYVAFGAPKELVVAAVLVFRAFTFLLPIVLGGVAYVVWQKHRGWRREPGDASLESATAS